MNGATSAAFAGTNLASNGGASGSASASKNVGFGVQGVGTDQAGALAGQVSGAVNGAANAAASTAYSATGQAMGTANGATNGTSLSAGGNANGQASEMPIRKVRPRRGAIISARTGAAASKIKAVEWLPVVLRLQAQSAGSPSPFNERASALGALSRKFVLPPCYVDGCRHPANAIINDALLCRKHALMELEHVIESRKATCGRAV